jgi:hypothetical protein
MYFNLKMWVNNKRLMSQFVCKYCGNTFAHQPGLSRHIRGSKKCIASRSTGTPKELLECECGYFTARLDNLERHQKKCRVVHIAKTIPQPPVVHITNNNFYGDVNFNNSYYRQYVIDNFESISNQLLEEAAATLKLGDIQSGGKGLARHAKKYINDLIMLDYPRKKALYKDETGEALVDEQLSKLTTRVAQAYHPPARALFKGWISSPLEDHQLPLVKQTAEFVAWMNRFGNGGEGGDTRQDRVFENDYKNELSIGYSRDDFRSRVIRDSMPPPVIEECEPIEIVDVDYDNDFPTPSEDTSEFIAYVSRHSQIRAATKQIELCRSPTSKQSSAMDRYRQMCAEATR